MDIVFWGFGVCIGLALRMATLGLTPFPVHLYFLRVFIKFFGKSMLCLISVHLCTLNPCTSLASVEVLLTILKMEDPIHTQYHTHMSEYRVHPGLKEIIRTKYSAYWYYSLFLKLPHKYSPLHSDQQLQV